MQKDNDLFDSCILSCMGIKNLDCKHEINSDIGSSISSKTLFFSYLTYEVRMYFFSYHLQNSYKSSIISLTL